MPLTKGYRMLYEYWFDYHLVEGCKDIIFMTTEEVTGVEEATDSYIKCAENITKMVDKCLVEEFKKRGYFIYDIRDKKEVTFDVLLNPFFLFMCVSFSYYNTEYVVTKDKDYLEKYGDIYYGAWLKQQNDGFVLIKDEDGQGIIIYLSDEKEEHNWFIDKMKEFDKDRFSPTDFGDDFPEGQTFFEFIKEVLSLIKMSFTK